MIEQGTPEWFAQRLGKVTASRVADVIAKTKSGPAASRQNYMVELALERLTGARQESYSNAAMQWGTDTEPKARVAYELHTNNMVLKTGLVDHPTIPMTGASPDGLVDDDGLLEIKCPNSATHVDTLLTGFPQNKYVTQMMWQMACTGRQWCDFVSFDPRFPANMQLFVKRIGRNENTIGALETEVKLFLRELDTMVETLNNRK
jgi:putative phage-type endonuclease